MTLKVCEGCGHRRYDPGCGCERRSCGYVRPVDVLAVDGRS